MLTVDIPECNTSEDDTCNESPTQEGANAQGATVDSPTLKGRRPTFRGDSPEHSPLHSPKHSPKHRRIRARSRAHTQSPGRNSGYSQNDGGSPIRSPQDSPDSTVIPRNWSSSVGGSPVNSPRDSPERTAVYRNRIGSSPGNSPWDSPQTRTINSPRHSRSPTSPRKSPKARSPKHHSGRAPSPQSSPTHKSSRRTISPEPKKSPRQSSTPNSPRNLTPRAHSPRLSTDGTSTNVQTPTERLYSFDAGHSSGTDEHAPIWKLFGNGKFKARLCNKLAEAWMSKEERMENYGSKMDCIVKDKWKSLLRRKLFALTRSAAVALVETGRIEACSHEQLEEQVSRFTASALRSDIEKKLQEDGCATEWMGKPRNEEEEQYNYTHSSYIDAVVRSNPVLAKPSISSRIKKLWKVLMLTLAGVKVDKHSPSNVGTLMPQQLYNKITSRIYLFFIPGLSATQALHIARFMWTLDCEDEARYCDGLSYEGFHNLIIDVACSWCQDQTEKEFLKILKMVARIIIPGEVAEQYVQLKCKMNAGRRTRQKTKSVTSEDVEQELQQLLTKASGMIQRAYSPPKPREESAGATTALSQEFERIKRAVHRNASPKRIRAAPVPSTTFDDGIQEHFSLSEATATSASEMDDSDWPPRPFVRPVVERASSDVQRPEASLPSSASVTVTHLVLGDKHPSGKARVEAGAQQRRQDVPHAQEPPRDAPHGTVPSGDAARSKSEQSPADPPVAEPLPSEPHQKPGKSSKATKLASHGSSLQVKMSTALELGVMGNKAGTVSCDARATTHAQTKTQLVFMRQPTPQPAVQVESKVQSKGTDQTPPSPSLRRSPPRSRKPGACSSPTLRTSTQDQSTVGPNQSPSLQADASEGEIGLEDLVNLATVDAQLEQADSYQKMCVTLAAATKSISKPPLVYSGDRIELLGPKTTSSHALSISDNAADTASSDVTPTCDGGPVTPSVACDPHTAQRLLNEAVQRAQWASRIPFPEGVLDDASIGYLERLKKQLEGGVTPTSGSRESTTRAAACAASEEDTHIAQRSTIMGPDYASFMSTVKDSRGHAAAGDPGLAVGSATKAARKGRAEGKAARGPKAKAGVQGPRHARVESPSLEQTILLRHCNSFHALQEGDDSAQRRQSGKSSKALRTLIKFMAAESGVIPPREQAKILDAVTD